MSELPDPLSLIWMSLDDPEMVFSHNDLSRYQPERVANLKKTKLLVETNPAEIVGCPECDGRHAEKVMLFSGVDETNTYWVPCPEAGRVKIEPSELVRWKVDLDMLARVIKEDLGIEKGHRVSQPLVGRVWRLGTTRPDNRETREVYLATSAGRLTASDLSVLPKDGTRPIVLHGSGVQTRDFNGLRPCLVPLKHALTWNQNSVVIEKLFVHSVMAEVDESDRLSGIRQRNEIMNMAKPIVQEEMRSMERNDFIVFLHLQEGKTYSEIKKQLGENGIPISQTTISRVITNYKKRVTQFPQLAKKLNLNTPKFHPRDRKGRRIHDAQPIDNE